MAAEAQTRYLSLLTHFSLLTLLHAAVSWALADVPTNADNRLLCNVHTYQQVAFTYIVPKRFEGQFQFHNTTLFYKMKDDSTWQVEKIYPPSNVTKIAGKVDLHFRSTSLYQLRVTSKIFIWGNSSENSFDNAVSLCEFCSKTDPKNEIPPMVLKATNSTLKFSLTYANLCTRNKLCLATWQYKNLNQSTWTFLGQRPGSEDMEITGLNASTVYIARVLVQHNTECEPEESEDVPFIITSTLPVLDPVTPEHPPQVIKASNTSLTLITNCQDICGKGYIASWQYKKSGGFWKSAGEALASREMIIEDLQNATNYTVSFKLYWPSSSNHSEYSPSQEVRTCPNNIPEVWYMFNEKRETHSLTVGWTISNICRLQFLIRWKPFGSNGDKRFPFDSIDANGCPYNATLVHYNPEYHNYNFVDYASHYFTVKENITPATRYYFEVTAIDAEGRCSGLKSFETATPIEFWGGISVGLWILIIFGMLLLFGAVPACILLKKRVASRLAAGRDVTFSASSNGTGPNGEEIADMDAVIFHEPTTRILDRRSDT